MDTDQIEKSGINPIVPIVQRVQAMTRETMVDTIAGLYNDTGVGAFFRSYPMPSKDDSGHTLLTICQGGLGLPDRDYYFEKVHETKRESYLLYLEKVSSSLEIRDAVMMSRSESPTRPSRARELRQGQCSSSKRSWRRAT